MLEFSLEPGSINLVHSDGTLLTQSEVAAYIAEETRRREEDENPSLALDD